jgi:hypothetical protein
MSGSDSTYAAVLERVLLAIINAHTDAESEGRQRERLEAAMVALIGSVTPNRRNMHKAVLFMIRERQKDVCDFEMRSFRSCAEVSRGVMRSVSELASTAARKVMGCTTAAEVQATASILCDLFRGKAYGEEPDHVRETLEVEAVQRLCNEFAEWGVPTRF